MVHLTRSLKVLVALLGTTLLVSLLGLALLLSRVMQL